MKASSLRSCRQLKFPPRGFHHQIWYDMASNADQLAAAYAMGRVVLAMLTWGKRIGITESSWGIETAGVGGDERCYYTKDGGLTTMTACHRNGPHCSHPIMAASVGRQSGHNGRRLLRSPPLVFCPPG